MPGEKEEIILLESFLMLNKGSMGMDALIPCAFWLSNVHELYSLICLEEYKFKWNSDAGVISTLDSIKKCKDRTE